MHRAPDGTYEGTLAVLSPELALFLERDALPIEPCRVTSPILRRCRGRKRREAGVPGPSPLLLIYGRINNFGLSGCRRYVFFIHNYKLIRLSIWIRNRSRPETGAQLGQRRTRYIFGSNLPGDMGYCFPVLSS